MPDLSYAVGPELLVGFCQSAFDGEQSLGGRSALSLKVVQAIGKLAALDSLA